MSTGIWSDEPELLWPCDSQESTEKDQKEGAHVLYVCWQIRTSSCLWRIRRTLRLGSRGLPSNAKAAGITTLLPYICLLAAYITRLKEAGKSLRLMLRPIFYASSLIEIIALVILGSTF